MELRNRHRFFTFEEDDIYAYQSKQATSEKSWYSQAKDTALQGASYVKQWVLFFFKSGNIAETPIERDLEAGDGYHIQTSIHVEQESIDSHV